MPDKENTTTQSVTANRTRVLIVDDHPLIRDGLRSLLATEADLEICAEAGDVLEAKHKLEQTAPDIVSLDLMLKGSMALNLVTWIKKHYPSTAVIITSMYEEVTYGYLALRAGACGYVCKQGPSRTLIKAIRHVRNGELYFSKPTIQRVMNLTRTGSGTLMNTPAEVLSTREIEIFRLIGEGRKTSEIAATLNLGRSTVDTYRERIKEKLGLHNSAELTYAAINHLRDIL